MHFSNGCNKLQGVRSCFFNKDQDIGPEEDPLIILDSNSSVCMAKNVKYTKHTRHIDRIVNYARNGENWQIQKIGWCEGSLQLADIGTNNVGEIDFNPRIKYIMVRIDNWDRTIVQEGWQDTR